MNTIKIFWGKKMFTIIFLYCVQKKKSVCNITLFFKIKNIKENTLDFISNFSSLWNQPYKPKQYQKIFIDLNRLSGNLLMCMETKIMKVACYLIKYVSKNLFLEFSSQLSKNIILPYKCEVWKEDKVFFCTLVLVYT